MPTSEVTRTAGMSVPRKVGRRVRYVHMGAVREEHDTGGRSVREERAQVKPDKERERRLKGVRHCGAIAPEHLRSKRRAGCLATERPRMKKKRPRRSVGTKETPKKHTKNTTAKKKAEQGLRPAKGGVAEKQAKEPSTPGQKSRGAARGCAVHVEQGIKKKGEGLEVKVRRGA